MTEQQEIIFNFAKGIFKPRPYLTGSEWADEHFMLSAESSSLPGKWTTRPYQREILDQASRVLELFTSNDIRGQTRDYSSAVDASRAALRTLEKTHGALLKRSWNKL